MGETTKFYNRYNSKPIKDGTSFKGMEEVCDQQSAEECEINRLLHQYEAGDISQLPVVREAVYNDIMITPQSYEDSKALIDKVTKDYYSLPVDVQRQFGDITNYVSDISKIAQGDKDTLAKYSNFEVLSPLKADVNSSASEVSSSSISRSDSGNSSSIPQATDNGGSAEKGV